MMRKRRAELIPFRKRTIAFSIFGFALSIAGQ
jgi:hypothetical protein